MTPTLTGNGQFLQILKILKERNPWNPWRQYHARATTEIHDPHVISNNRTTHDESDLTTALRILFNADTDKTNVVQEFKRVVQKLNADPTPSSLLTRKDSNVVKKLLLDVLGPQHNKGQTKAHTIQSLSRKMNIAIQRGKISNNLIAKRIKQFKETQPINVNIPLKVSTDKTKYQSENKDLKPSLSLNLTDTTSKGKTNIVEVLDLLETHLLNNKRNQNDLYQIFSNILEETKPENLVNTKSHTHPNNDTINLDHLTSYLQKMEVQESQKQSVLKEQQRVYNWNDSVKTINQANKLIVHDILSLFNPLSWIFRKNKFLQRSVWNLSGNKPIMELSYMILDLKTGRKEKYDDKAERLPINIQNKDMFEIVNNSQLHPEESLSKIKAEQQNNWKLLGTLYNNNNKAIFEKRVSKTKRSYIPYFLGTSIILLVGGFSYKSYKLYTEPKPLEQTPSQENRDSS